MCVEFRAKTVTISPGAELLVVRTEWADRIVIVEQGTLDIECSAGTSAEFRQGAVLTFAGVSVRRFRNRGDILVVLKSLSRAE